MEVQSIYYNDNTNSFEDDFGNVEYDISDILELEQVIYYKKVGGTCYSNVGGEDFKIEFPTKGLSRSIYYDPKENVMLDEDSNIIYNIFSLITANDLFLFKKNKESINISGIAGETIEMVYPNISKSELLEDNLTDEQAFELINRREMQMLVHSYIYYKLNDSMWTDKEFDGRARELARLLIKYPKIANQMVWNTHFIGWDGTTGFNLPFEHPDVIRVSENMYRNWKSGKQE